MTRITTQSQVDAFVWDADAELAISPQSLAILARVGLICGPVTTIDVRIQGRIAIVKIEPLADPDPILPIPMVDASPTAWARLRAFYLLLTHLNDPQWSDPLRREAHTEAVAMIPKVAAAFARYLDPVELKRFEQWLGVALLGDAQVRGVT